MNNDIDKILGEPSPYWQERIDAMIEDEVVWPFGERRWFYEVLNEHVIPDDATTEPKLES